MFLLQQSSISSIYRLLVQKPRPILRLVSRTAVTFIVLTLLFVLSFPTLVDALAGYAASTEGYVKEIGGKNYIKFSNFDLVAYIIHDAERVGLAGGDYILPFRMMENVGM
jgi:hypothetical protein